METGKIVLGALATFAAGALVGVLLAPDKGSETRRKIAQKGTDVVDGLKEKFSSLKHKYNEIIDDLSDKIASVTHHEQEYTRRKPTEKGDINRAADSIEVGQR